MIGPGKKAKRGKKGEENYAPELTPGEDETSQQKHKHIIEKELAKSNKYKDDEKISASMGATYASRHSVINNNAPIIELKNKYPALFTPKELVAEFERLIPTSKGVEKKVTDSLLRISKGILEICSKANHDEETSSVIHIQSEKISECENRAETAILACSLAVWLLPTLFNEEKNIILLDTANGAAFKLSDVVEPVIVCKSLDAEYFTIYGEGIEMLECSIITDAVLSLLCFYYVLNIEYPKGLAKTFAFLQNTVLGIKARKVPTVVISIHEKLKKMKTVWMYARFIFVIASVSSKWLNMLFESWSKVEGKVWPFTSMQTNLTLLIKPRAGCFRWAFSVLVCRPLNPFVLWN